MPRHHREHHRSDRIGWLRAAVLGANDGIVSTASLILGISEALGARPLQAALASAASFGVGAALPLIVVAFAPGAGLIDWVAATAIVFLAVLGAVSARAGGASIAVGTWRVTFWGTLAMAITAGVGKLFAAVV